MNPQQENETGNVQNRKRILVIKLSALGDLFHSLPAVHNLKMALGASIDWCTQAEYVDLVRCFPDVDRVISFPRHGFLAGFAGFRKDLQVDRYDLVIDFQGLLKSGFVAMLARGKRKIGPSFHREGSRIFYSEVAGKVNKERHAVEEGLDVVRHLGLNVIAPEFPVKFPDIQVQGGRPRIGLLPVSRWGTKNWPVHSFAATALKLKKLKNASIHIIGSQEDVPVCNELAMMISNGVQNHAGKYAIVESGGLIKNLDLLIANDSGPVHMAVAVGTPTLVVFGPTDPVRTGPYGAPHKVAFVKLPCRPCYSRDCQNGDRKCLLGVTPEHVTEIALEMLK